ncbi:MAG: hypothetical protein RXQ80_02465 [Sulfolobaceae archaeon]
MNLELLIRIIYATISIILLILGGIHIILYKLKLPGFEGRWAINLGTILLTISIALLVVAFLVL